MSDQVKNGAYSTTTAAVTSVATSFSVQSGHGSRFSATTLSGYNLCVWNPNYPTFAIALQNSQAEIVRVTTRSTDTFSVIVRAREGTSAIAWGVGWRVEENITADKFPVIAVTTGQVTSIGATNFTVNTGRIYAVSFYIHTTQVGVGGTVTFTCSWNDGTSKTFTSATAALDATGNTGMVSGRQLMYVASGTPTWNTTVAGGDGTHTYSARVEIV